MAITKTVRIDDKDVVFRASAAVPRMYRIKFRRDIFADLQKLSVETKGNDPENSELAIESLEIFENISYIMAKHGAPDQVPDSVDEWLDQFNTFSIYTILPEILDLWGLNIAQQSESKKKLEQLTGK